MEGVSGIPHEMTPRHVIIFNFIIFVKLLPVPKHKR